MPVKLSLVVKPAIVVCDGEKTGSLNAAMQWLMVQKSKQSKLPEQSDQAGGSEELEKGIRELLLVGDVVGGAGGGGKDELHHGHVVQTSELAADVA